MLSEGNKQALLLGDNTDWGRVMQRQEDSLQMSPLVPLQPLQANCPVPCIHSFLGIKRDAHLCPRLHVVLLGSGVWHMVGAD